MWPLSSFRLGGRGIQNADETDRLNWYTSVLFTF